jgi:hypothetical protein
MARSGKQSVGGFALLLLIAAVTASFLAGPIYLLSGWVTRPARPLVCPSLASAPGPALRPATLQPTAKPMQAAPRRVSTLGSVGVIAGLAFFLVIWVLASLAVMGFFSLVALLLPALAIGTCLSIAARYVAFFRTRFAWIGVSAGAGIVGQAVWLEHSLSSCRPLNFCATLIVGVMTGWLMRRILKRGWIDREAVG